MKILLILLIAACGATDPPTNPDAAIPDTPVDAFEQDYCTKFCLSQAPLNQEIFEYCLSNCVPPDCGVP